MKAHFAAAMAHSVAKARPEWKLAIAIGDRMAHFGVASADSCALFGKGWNDPECDLVSRLLQLERGVKNH